MFNIFRKRKKSKPIEQWEILLLSNTLDKLPQEYTFLKAQIAGGLLASSLIGYNPEDLNYVAFAFNPDNINDFEDESKEDFEISGIKVHDKKYNKPRILTIYVFANVISGYTISGDNHFDIDVNSVDVENFSKRYYKTNDFERIRKILTEQETKLINASQVYEVLLKEGTYFHIKDLEDGDFIAIDSQKNIYKITHDPYEILPLNDSIERIMKNQ